MAERVRRLPGETCQEWAQRVAALPTRPHVREAWVCEHGGLAGVIVRKPPKNKPMQPAEVTYRCPVCRLEQRHGTRPAPEVASLW